MTRRFGTAIAAYIVLLSVLLTTTARAETFPDTLVVQAATVKLYTIEGTAVKPLPDRAKAGDRFVIVGSDEKHYRIDVPGKGVLAVTNDAKLVSVFKGAEKPAPAPPPPPPAPAAPPKPPFYQNKYLQLGGVIVTFLVLVVILINWMVSSEQRERQLRQSHPKPRS
ncbi:MAG: hypothetical protein HY340_00870 [Candidatus Kerfeldbacteria bacterium]|nr:hypothetical protein [Candidatus Kerfeldbacteria bacterium]